jgi:stalled ribosome alternative rescue factor ArfA
MKPLLEKPRIVLEEWNRDAATYIPKTHVGITWNINGYLIDIFRINVLASAVNRSTSMVRKWEISNKLPEPLFRSDQERTKLGKDKSYDRYYSRHQIELAHKLAKKHGMLKKRVTPDLFFIGLQKSFYKEEEELEKVMS